MSDEAILHSTHPQADRRIAYGSHAEQFGDLRLPEPAVARHPLVMMIHGGFWRAKYDLEHLGCFCEALQARGIATWNIEYRRLGNGGGWPTTFLDVGQAVDYVQVVAQTYPLDLQRVIVVGHSAGGHLALWAAGRNHIPADSELFQDQPCIPGAVVCLAGVSNLQLAWQQRLSQRVVQEFIGGTPEQVPARYAQASPSERVPLGVPQILIHGTADGPVPFDLSQQYVTTARTAGDNATLIPLHGARHFEMIDPTTPQWQIVAAAIQGLLS